MAAFLTGRLLSPRAVPAVAALSPAPLVICRRSIDLFAVVTTILRASGESLLLLWMLAVILFSVLITAGSVGLLR
jgi:hypothetical protein